MLLSLLAANHVPWLERYALARDLTCAGAFAAFMLIPLARFRLSPQRMFLSGMLGWSIFSLAYLTAGGHFENLFIRLRTPGIAFTLGALLYGLVAVAYWVVMMLRTARHNPVHLRRRSRPAAPR